MKKSILTDFSTSCFMLAIGHTEVFLCLPQNLIDLSLYTAEIAVNLCAQAVKILCFTEGAAIYFHIWHIYFRSIGDLNPQQK